MQVTYYRPPRELQKGMLMLFDRYPRTIGTLSHALKNGMIFKKVACIMMMIKFMIRIKMILPDAELGEFCA